MWQKKVNRNVNINKTTTHEKTTHFLANIVLIFYSSHIIIDERHIFIEIIQYFSLNVFVLTNKTNRQLFEMKY